MARKKQELQSLGPVTSAETDAAIARGMLAGLPDAYHRAEEVIRDIRNRAKYLKREEMERTCGHWLALLKIWKKEGEPVKPELF